MMTMPDLDPNESKIVQWYKGRDVFITGGTGFMGKVLLEKLLFTCRGIGNLYVLMRSKKGRTPEQRVDDMWKLPCFSRLHKQFPETRKKIVPVQGDLITNNLGLSDTDLQMLVENVSVVFHCAATLKLEATLKDAVDQNTGGTLRVIDVAKTFQKMDVFVHMSTAFCSADLDRFEEKVYPSKHNARDVVEVCKWMQPEALNMATKALIAPHGNTYTYSKRLAESLVAEELKDKRVTIVRPSIVTPSSVEPVPGWVDTLNGPMGLLVAAGKGVLRSMNCNGEYRAHMVPVDIAINAMIVIAHKTATDKKTEEIPVYNFTSDGALYVTWSDILQLGRDVCKKYPFEYTIWYPDGNIRSSYYIHMMYVILFQWLPAYFIDMLLFIFRQKRFMVRVQQKIHDGLELLHFFTTREWFFSSDKFFQMRDSLDPLDKEIFQMDFLRYPVDEYMRVSALGTRQYTMKESLDSLPRCRINIKILYVIDLLTRAAFYAGLVWLVCSCSDTAKSLFDFVGYYAKNIPIIGSIVPTN